MEELASDAFFSRFDDAVATLGREGPAKKPRFSPLAPLRCWTFCAGADVDAGSAPGFIADGSSCLPVGCASVPAAESFSVHHIVGLSLWLTGCICHSCSYSYAQCTAFSIEQLDRYVK